MHEFQQFFFTFDSLIGALRAQVSIFLKKTLYHVIIDVMRYIPPKRYLSLPKKKSDEI